MCEIPSNALSADDLLKIFDGFSVGSNALTQLTLGLERDPAVKIPLGMAIAAANKVGRYIGICGQGPSDHPDLAELLIDQGISSISLNPDTVVDTRIRPAGHKKG